MYRQDYQLVSKILTPKTSLFYPVLDLFWTYFVCFQPFWASFIPFSPRFFRGWAKCSTYGKVQPLYGATQPCGIKGIAFVSLTLNSQTMEKRTFGIVLTILGIIGLIAAGVTFMQGSGGTYSIKTIILYSILGLVFFSAGIGLLRNTNDKAT